MLAPMIIKIDDAKETMAMETNSFIESISEVRFVRSFEGFVCCM